MRLAHDVFKIARSWKNTTHAFFFSLHRISSPLSYSNSRMRLKGLESKSIWAHALLDLHCARADALAINCYDTVGKLTV